MQTVCLLELASQNAVGDQLLGESSEILSCHLATPSFYGKRSQMDTEGKMAGSEIRRSEGPRHYPVDLPPPGHGPQEDMRQGKSQPSSGKPLEHSSFCSVGFLGLSLDGRDVFGLSQSIRSPVSLGLSLAVCPVTTGSVWKKRS